MSKIKIATPFAPITSLQITTETPVSAIDDILANTSYTLPAGADGTLALDDGEDTQPVELGDFLLRLANDVFVYEADEFSRHFLTV